MQGYCVLVCSASWALGRAGKHNFKPHGATESTAFSSGQWIIHLIVDRPNMSGSQDLLINHSLEGSGGNHQQALEPMRSNVSNMLQADRSTAVPQNMSSSNHHDILSMNKLHLTLCSHTTLCTWWVTMYAHLDVMTVMAATMFSTLLFLMCNNNKGGRWVGSIYQDALLKTLRDNR